MTDQFAAGWYPDPAGTPRLRYFDGHAWTEQYAALAPAAWPPPQTASAPIKRQERAWWKRKRVLIPAAVMGIVVINVANTPRSVRVATSPATTIATQVLAAEVTSTVVPSSSTTAEIRTTVATPASTVPTTSAATTAATTSDATAPPQVLPIAAPVDTEPPAAEPETSTAATAEQTTATKTAQAASVYFNSCAEARAAGAAPLKRGDPGYRAGLDRDNDGIACE
jgi:Excalibur calcium-binding domain/Protein of unknown function (DUF2510)